MLRYTERRKVRLIAEKLFSENSKLYDHDTSTSLTGEQTTQLGLVIPRYARLRAVKIIFDGSLKDSSSLHYENAMHVSRLGCVGSFAVLTNRSEFNSRL